MTATRILLVVGGGIAAYKACELVRLLRKDGLDVTCVLTDSGAQFVTAMSLAALSGNRVHTSLWDAGEEADIGHIALSRSADLVVVCPATANLLAKMATGIADDLATTLLLATDKRVLAVPAMNVRMWQHAATQRNLARLRADGIVVMSPDEGPMACGEFGPGRLPEPPRIAAEIARLLDAQPPGGSLDDLVGDPLFGQEAFDPAPPHRPLYGRHLLVTAGPTHEAIDPVRYIANRSSGRQGFAIAAAAAEAGARVTLVAGPVALPTPPGVERIDVETAAEMALEVSRALPADCAILVAAVADWRVAGTSDHKLKKTPAGPPLLELTENPDILATLATPGPERPRLVIGFAAETHNLVANAQAKRARKGADWILANDVAGRDGSSAFGSTENEVHLIRADSVASWPRMSKEQVAHRLVEEITRELGNG